MNIDISEVTPKARKYPCFLRHKMGFTILALGIDMDGHGIGFEIPIKNLGSSYNFVEYPDDWTEVSMSVIFSS